MVVTWTLQLSMLPANKEYYMGIQKVTVCVFPNTMLRVVDRLLQIFVTVPLTSAIAERTFSTLR